MFPRISRENRKFVFYLWKPITPSSLPLEAPVTIFWKIKVNCTSPSVFVTELNMDEVSTPSQP